VNQGFIGGAFRKESTVFVAESIRSGSANGAAPYHLTITSALFVKADVTARRTGLGIPVIQTVAAVLNDSLFRIRKGQ
jgi:hypothetical protein